MRCATNEQSHPPLQNLPHCRDTGSCRTSTRLDFGLWSANETTCGAAQAADNWPPVPNVNLRPNPGRGGGGGGWNRRQQRNSIQHTRPATAANTTQRPGGLVVFAVYHKTGFALTHKMMALLVKHRVVRLPTPGGGAKVDTNCTAPSLIPTVNGNTVRSLSTHGQQSAAKGSSTTVSRTAIR